MKEKISKITRLILPLLILYIVNYYIAKYGGSSNGHVYLKYILITVSYCLVYFIINTSNKYLSVMNIHRIRYYIAGLVFIILVLFKFHGSSIGMWDDYYKDYGDNTVKTTYSGKARSIRSDEWLVQTPLYLAQVTGKEKLERINENIRSDGQDMALAAYAPVLDATILGKPFNWGFLFLDKERAFSWYWNLKIIALFMLSYEMSLILTKKNKKISLLGATLIAFAPASQWWFSTSVVDLIIFAQAIIVSTYYYLRSEHFRNKILNVILFTISGIGFVISLYPPIQISLGYLILIIFFHLVIKNRKTIKKKDAICLGVAILSIALVVGYFVFTARDAINIMLNTVYPGQRLELGGTYDLKMLSNYIFGWMLPYRDVTFLNSSEASGFISLLPVAVLLFFFRKREDKDNKLVISIFIYILIMLSFLIVTYPEILAKLTLFSYIPENRMALTLGIASTYLIIMLLPNLIENKKSVIQSIILTIISILIIFVPQYHTEVQYYLSNKGLALSIMLFATLIYFIIRGHMKELIPYGITFMIITGFFVNPISRTLAPIYGKEVSKSIISINSDNPGKWVAIDSLVAGDFLYANGVETFNGVHYYPDLNMWKSLDKDNKYEDIYNRYAHVIVDITKEDTSFSLGQQDVLVVNISVKDLDKAGIEYILSNKKLNDFNTENKTTFKELYFNKIDNTYIYQYLR